MGINPYILPYHQRGARRYRSTTFDYVDYSLRTAPSQSIPILDMLPKLSLQEATAACSRICELNDTVALSAILRFHPEVITSRNEENLSVLGCASYSGSLDCIVELFHHAHMHGILEKIILDEHNFRHASLEMACTWGITSAVLMHMCACPESINCRMDGGLSPLHYASFCSHVKGEHASAPLVALLLEVGGTPLYEARSDGGLTALDIAETSYRSDMADKKKFGEILSLLRQWGGRNQAEKEALLSKYETVKKYRENVSKHAIQKRWAPVAEGAPRQTSFDLFCELQGAEGTHELKDMQEFILCCAISHFAKAKSSSLAFACIQKHQSIFREIKTGTRAHYELHGVLLQSLKNDNMDLFRCLLHCVQENFLPPFDFGTGVNLRMVTGSWPLIFHIASKKEEDWLGLALASKALACNCTGNGIHALGIANVKFRTETLWEYMVRKRQYHKAALLKVADSTFQGDLLKHANARSYLSVKKWNRGDYSALIQKGIIRLPESVNISSSGDNRGKAAKNQDDLDHTLHTGTSASSQKDSSTYTDPENAHHAEDTTTEEANQA